MTDEARDRMRKLRRAYKAMLLCVDEQIGRLFEVLEEEGMWDNTVIVFTTDHGEMLGDHGHFQKSRYQWQSATVPTAIRHPDYLTGARLDSVVELTDLTATILEVAGLDPQEALAKPWPAFNTIIPCRSLMPIVRGEAQSVRPFAFSECSGAWQMIQDDHYKYVRLVQPDPDGEPNERLFDLMDDPNETRNLAADPASQPVLATARARLLDVLASTPPAQTRWAPLTGSDGTTDCRIGG